MNVPSLSYASTSILLAIGTGYRYGFDVMDITGLPSGTVYPALRRLEQSGLIASIARAGETALGGALKRYPLLERMSSQLPQKTGS